MSYSQYFALKAGTRSPNLMRAMQFSAFNSSPLTLCFSNAFSKLSLEEFFNSARKEMADPHGFVKPRSKSQLFELAKQGHIATVTDQNARIQALCVAYPFDVDIDGQKTSVTEIGTLISCVKGKGLSELVITALAEKIKNNSESDHRIIAKVAVDNPKANQLFEQKLDWDHEKTPQVIGAYYSSDMGTTARQERHSELKNWYSFGHGAKQKGMERFKNAPDIALDI